MKRITLFYRWVFVAIATIVSFTTAFADTKVTSLDQLTAGTTIRIYPYRQGYLPYMALACSGDGKPLSPLYEALSGNVWTLIDAGEGYFYLKNELGCYWAYQDNKCTTDVNAAVAVQLTWDSYYGGINFWNKTDGLGLNNINGVSSCYYWYSNPSNHCGDSNTTFEVYVSDGEPSEYKNVEVDGFKCFLDLTKKTASVLPNDYKGDIVVPQSVDYEGTIYAVTALNMADFTSCTSIDARYCDVGNIATKAFWYNSNITSLSIGHADIIGERAFSDCSKLTSVSIGNVSIIKHGGFYYCSKLTSLSIGTVGDIGEKAFQECFNLPSVSIGNVGSIGECAFSSCKKLESVSIGNVGSIGERAFSSCEKLASISIGHVGSIENMGFESCSSLASVNIDSVDSIKKDAFRYLGEPLITIKQLRHIEALDSRELRNITLKCYVENPEDIEATEKAYGGLKRLFVPKSSVEDYKNTKPWSYMPNRIYPIADIPVTQIVLPETAHIKEKGEEGKIQLVPTFYPEDADIKTVEWKSSDENIVKVDENGYVTGVNMGEANIIVTSLDGSEKSDTCKVTVGAIDPEAITFVGMPTEVYVGSYIENVTKKVKVTPEDADYTALTITTSDKDVLRYYNTDKILAKSIGTAQVIATLTLTDGLELSTSCDVNVVEDPTGVNTVTANEVKAMVSGNRLSVEGLAADDVITVANVSGQTLYRGTRHEIVLPSNGVYIIKVKGEAIKVSVK